MILEHAIRARTAAKLSGVTWRTLLRRISKGDLRATKVGQTWLIDREDFREFMAVKYPATAKGGRPRKPKQVFETTVPGRRGLNIDVVLAKAKPIKNSNRQLTK